MELKKDFDRRLEQNKNEYEQELAVFEANLDESKEKIDEFKNLDLYGHKFLIPRYYIDGKYFGAQGIPYY